MEIKEVRETRFYTVLTLERLAVAAAEIASAAARYRISYDAAYRELSALDEILQAHRDANLTKYNVKMAMRLPRKASAPRWRR